MSHSLIVLRARIIKGNYNVTDKKYKLSVYQGLQFSRDVVEKDTSSSNIILGDVLWGTHHVANDSLQL